MTALILLCLSPVIAARLYIAIALRGELQSGHDALIKREAELAGSDLRSVIATGETITRLIAALPSVRALDPDCAADLVALQRQLPEYAFTAVIDADGVIVCSSQPRADGGDLAVGRHLPWAADMLAAGDAAVGRYTVMPQRGPFLPMASAIPASNRSNGAVVVALDLRRFADRLAALWRELAPLPAGAAVVVTDRDGVIVARYPDTGDWIGRPLPEDAPATGELAASIIGGDRPPNPMLFRTQEILLMAGAAFLSVVLAVLAGRRFYMRPMQGLLLAAQSWRAGDLGARADETDGKSPFGRLAASFNAMASALQARDAELRDQADRLTARAHALSATNNRLQVEIAEREKTEAALHQAQKLQAVGQLAGGVAHDFNNMLATVLGSLELMERRVQTAALRGDPAESQRLLDLIERAIEAVQRGAQLTNRLLAFSRRQRLAVRPTDINRLIADLVTLAAGTLGRGVRVRTDLAADLWPALADPSQVEAALLNLCLNARDAMPGGGELLISSANATSSRHASDGLAPGDYVRIAVRDTGAGMTADVQARAFEPFFSTKGPAGSGLGLSQVYGLARQSGGTVRIASQPGRGTEVTLLLPRAFDPVQTRDPGAAAPRIADLRAPDLHVPDLRLPDLRVMVVDDDSAVRRVTVDMLRDLGCDVIEASCADEALALLDDAGPEIGLLLLDHVMPGLNGIELARALRARGVVAPVVLATGYAEMGDPAQAHLAPVDALLRKPFSITELRTVLLRLGPSAEALSQIKQM